jgi:hypothetical protein
VANVCRQCGNGVLCAAGFNCVANNCVAIPEAGPPEAGRDGTGDTSTDADARIDTTIDSVSEGGPPEAGGTDGDGAADTSPD